MILILIREYTSVFVDKLFKLVELCAVTFMSRGGLDVAVPKRLGRYSMDGCLGDSFLG